MPALIMNLEPALITGMELEKSPLYLTIFAIYIIFMYVLGLAILFFVCTTPNNFQHQHRFLENDSSNTL
uniref:Uncharacterized protein n=1 Tax=Strongyloides venezuelensis TaxID=75913 RepID=A0A0K0F0W1_STRVS